MESRSPTTAISARFGLGPIPTQRPAAAAQSEDSMAEDGLSDAAVFRPLDNSLAAQADEALTTSTNDSNTQSRSRRRQGRESRSAADKEDEQAGEELAYYASSVYIKDPIVAPSASTHGGRGAKNREEEEGEVQRGTGRPSHVHHRHQRHRTRSSAGNEGKSTKSHSKGQGHEREAEGPVSASKRSGRVGATPVPDLGHGADGAKGRTDILPAAQEGDTAVSLGDAVRAGGTPMPLHLQRQPPLSQHPNTATRGDAAAPASARYPSFPPEQSPSAMLRAMLDAGTPPSATVPSISSSRQPPHRHTDPYETRRKGGGGHRHLPSEQQLHTRSPPQAGEDFLQPAQSGGEAEGRRRGGREDFGHAESDRQLSPFADGRPRHASPTRSPTSSSSPSKERVYVLPTRTNTEFAQFVRQQQLARARAQAWGEETLRGHRSPRGKDQTSQGEEDEKEQRRAARMAPSPSSSRQRDERRVPPSVLYSSSSSGSSGGGSDHYDKERSVSRGKHLRQAERTSPQRREHQREKHSSLSPPLRSPRRQPPSRSPPHRVARKEKKKGKLSGHVSSPPPRSGFPSPSPRRDHHQRRSNGRRGRGNGAGPRLLSIVREEEAKGDAQWPEEEEDEREGGEERDSHEKKGERTAKRGLRRAGSSDPGTRQRTAALPRSLSRRHRRSNGDDDEEPGQSREEQDSESSQPSGGEGRWKRRKSRSTGAADTSPQRSPRQAPPFLEEKEARRAKPSRIRQKGVLAYKGPGVADRAKLREHFPAPGPSTTRVGLTDEHAAALTVPDTAQLSRPREQPSPPSRASSYSPPLTRRETEEVMLLALRHPRHQHSSSGGARHLIPYATNGRQHGHEEDGESSGDGSAKGSGGDARGWRRRWEGTAALLAGARAELRDKESTLLLLRCSLIAAYCRLGVPTANDARGSGRGDGSGGTGAGAPPSALVFSQELEERLQKAARRAVRHVDAAAGAVDALAPILHPSSPAAGDAATLAIAPPPRAAQSAEAELPYGMPFPLNLSLVTAAPITGTLDMHTAALFATASPAPVDGAEEEETEDEGKGNGRKRKSRSRRRSQSIGRKLEKRAWQRCFVVADDRGLLVFADSEDYACNRYHRLLGAIPYAGMLFFVPDFLVEPADVRVPSLVKRGERLVDSGSGGGAAPTAFSQAYCDYLEHTVQRCRLTDPASYYFGFIPRQRTSGCGGGADGHAFRAEQLTTAGWRHTSASRPGQPPPVLLRVSSAEAHRYWCTYIASRFNRHLFQTLFPPVVRPSTTTTAAPSPAAAATSSLLARSNSHRAADAGGPCEDVYDLQSKASQTEDEGSTRPGMLDAGTDPATAAATPSPCTKQTQAGNPILKLAHILTNSADRTAAGRQGKEREEPTARHALRRLGSSPPHYRESTLEDARASSLAKAHEDDGDVRTDRGVSKENKESTSPVLPEGGEATLAELKLLLDGKNDLIRQLKAKEDTAAAALAHSEAERLRLRDEKEELADRVRELTAVEAAQRTELLRLRVAADGGIDRANSSNNGGHKCDSGEAGKKGEQGTAASTLVLEQERANWAAQRRQLEERCRVLAAEVAALKTHNTASLRALAARAVGDLDTFHEGVVGSVEAYLSDLDRCAVVPHLPTKEPTDYFLSDANPVQDQPTPHAAAAAAEEEGRRKGKHAEKGVALLLLTYNSDLHLLDCCLTVDEAEAKLLASGPTTRRTGRHWSLHHYDSDAELTLDMSVVKVKPLRPWDRTPPAVMSSPRGQERSKNGSAVDLLASVEAAVQSKLATGYDHPAINPAAAGASVTQTVSPAKIGRSASARHTARGASGVQSSTLAKKKKQQQRDATAPKERWRI